MSEPTLCLKCLNFPCTCGEQYKSMSTVDYYRLLGALAELRPGIEITVDHANIINLLRGIPATQTAVFTQKEAANLPLNWRTFLKLQTDESKSLMECLEMLCSDKYDTDAMVFPSGLVWAILIKCKLLERNYVHLILHCLNNSKADPLYRQWISEGIDKNAARISTSMSGLSVQQAFIESPDTVIKANGRNPTELKRIILHINKYLRKLLSAIDDLAGCEAAEYWMALMLLLHDDSLPVDVIDQNLKEKKLLESRYNSDLFYVEQEWRQQMYLWLQKEKIRLPKLKLVEN